MSKSRSGSPNGKMSDNQSNHDSVDDKSDIEDKNVKSETDLSDSSEDAVSDKKALPDSQEKADESKKRSKSRSRSRSHHRRHHKSDRKGHRHGRHHRSRSRSTERHRKSRHKRRKHSRSSDRHKHRHRRSSSPKPSRHRSRSGSRSRRRSKDRYYRRRSRSGSYRRGSGRKLTFKDQMREKLLAADIAAAANIAESAKSEAAQGKIAAAQAAAKAASKGSNLMDAIEKARLAHEQQLKEMQEKAEAMTGVSIPKFYNPIAVNPLKYAEQQSKRKLLWSKKEDDKSDVQKNVNLWNATSLTAARGNDQAANKFRKLMGIHGELDPENLKGNELGPFVDQNELFNNLDQQYEAARAHTHTQRGVGLGYSQHAYIDPNNYNPPKQLDNGDHQS